MAHGQLTSVTEVVTVLQIIVFKIVAHQARIRKNDKRLNLSLSLIFLFQKILVDFVDILEFFQTYILLIDFLRLERL